MLFRSGMLITMLTVIMAGLFHIAPKLKNFKSIYIIGIIIFISCLLLSIAASKYGLTVPILEKLDKFLNGRILDLYWGSVNHEGTVAHWSLFSEARNTYYFDMGFVRVFYWYGIIPAITYFLLNILLIWECYKKRDTMGLTMLVVLGIYTVVEAHIISVYIGRNYILLLLGAYWIDIFRTRSSKEEYLFRSYKLLFTKLEADV